VLHRYSDPAPEVIGAASNLTTFNHHIKKGGDRRPAEPMRHECGTEVWPVCVFGSAMTPNPIKREM